MKNFTDYIIEKSFSTPDEIEFKDFYASWRDDRYAFIVNAETDFCVFGEAGFTHSDIVDWDKKIGATYYDDSYSKLRRRWYDKLGIKSDAYYGRFEKASYFNTKKANYDEWVKRNEDISAKFGGIWVVGDFLGFSYDEWNAKNPTGKVGELKDKGVVKFPIVLSWWDALTGKEFDRLNKIVIKQAFKELDNFNGLNIDDCEFWVTDNNGQFKLFDMNGKNTLTKRTKASQLKASMAKNIHLANQKEKEEFFAAFKKNRDEYLQKTLYNHTKSKTEAEYRSIKYQESLENEDNN